MSRRKKIVLKKEKALPFNIKVMAEKTVEVAKEYGLEKATELIDATMRLISSAFQAGHSKIQLKVKFNAYRRVVENANVGIKIDNSAFEKLIKMTENRMSLTGKIRKLDSKFNTNDNNN